MSDPLCTISVFCLRKSQQIISGGAEGDAKMQKGKCGNGMINIFMQFAQSERSMHFSQI